MTILDPSSATATFGVHPDEFRGSVIKSWIVQDTIPLPEVACDEESAAHMAGAQTGDLAILVDCADETVDVNRWIKSRENFRGVYVKRGYAKYCYFMAPLAETDASEPGDMAS